MPVILYGAAVRLDRTTVNALNYLYALCVVVETVVNIRIEHTIQCNGIGAFPLLV